MSVLVFPLIGEQAWATEARTKVRGTQPHPTKSGVLGLVANALGRTWADPIDDLVALRFGVRLDRPGVLGTDYQPVRDTRMANGKSKSSEVVFKCYLYDAAFLVALEGAEGLLRSVQDALRQSARQIVLGRRNCLPHAPLWLPDGFYPQGTLEQALAHYPALVPVEKHATLRALIDDPQGSEVFRDVPKTHFDPDGYDRHKRRAQWLQIPVANLSMRLEVTDAALH